jgi:hypothetical protein
MKKVMTTVTELKDIFPGKENKNDIERLEKIFLSEQFPAHILKTKTHLTYSIEPEKDNHNLEIILIKNIEQGE